MTGDAAVRGIRELDPNGSIGMIGNENDMPYARPPLSKGMWKGRPLEKVWLGTNRLAGSYLTCRRWPLRPHIRTGQFRSRSAGHPGQSNLAFIFRLEKILPAFRHILNYCSVDFEGHNTRIVNVEIAIRILLALNRILSGYLRAAT